MAGRATGAGSCHPHDATQRRLIGNHEGGFHFRLSDLQAVTNHVLGAAAVFVHGLTTGVASVRLNLSSRQHPSRLRPSVNSAFSDGLRNSCNQTTKQYVTSREFVKRATSTLGLGNAAVA